MSKRIVTHVRKQDSMGRWTVYAYGNDGKLYWFSDAKTERGSKMVLSREAKRRGCIVEGNEAVRYED
jgi:hypothetical protein|nr:MAG TPA: hypothetical protein [Caudoviricetes sp.]